MKYFTVDRLCLAETEERKSRFIAHLFPVVALEATLERLRNEHRKANHHVLAFRKMLDSGLIQEMSKDDGEPSGTSGMPVLKTMQGAQLMDCALVVTRYFGGTKLGTGGLARAYSAAARQVIETAKLVLWEQVSQIRLSVSFAQTASVEKLVDDNRIEVLSRQYHETGVEMFLKGNAETLASLEEAVSQK